MKFKINRELTEKEIQDAVVEKYPDSVKMDCEKKGLSVRTSIGDAMGGYCSAVRTNEGNAEGGDVSAVRTEEGNASVGENGVAMGTSVELGENSVGAILNECGEIIKVKIKINGELKTIWEK